MGITTRIGALAAETGALLLAASCAGCEQPGTMLCDPCLGALAPVPREVRTPDGLRVQAALVLDGPAASCIRRLKGAGETVLARPLGVALAAVLLPALVPGAWVIPVPTSRAAFRRRGYRVPELLVRRAGAEPQRVLALTRRVRDQRELPAAARSDNVRGAMRARRQGHGASAVLVDDVVTTGATLDESTRALTAAGFVVIGAVALAATPSPTGSG
ncbi:ComF family protein [Microbacterium sp. K36]|uniref:ComF family protein n=1 Tax=Microbacterium sp. K36 TaxID=2305439 RepID=UPI00109C8156|nr:phosphoribosyltransferase family protein [Microbacterium sp. K36]